MKKRLQSLFYAWSKHRLPQTNGRIYLSPLHQPVTIRRDQWGIPHISATNRHDLFIAQGFVHAQDRLWQMELNRRVAHGTLSQLFGRLTLDTDRLSRTLGFARLAQTTWQRLSPQARHDVEAYTAGINAYLHSQPALPLELQLIHHRPTPWQPLDTIAYGRLQMWALTQGASGELIYAQLINQLGPQKAQELMIHYPAENPATLPDGIEVNNALKTDRPHTAVHPFLGKGGLDGAGRGSNGWVIAASRSTTSHPILCNDMHLPLGTPSLWHYQHLHSQDGLHVAGFSQPGLPYILIGHNQHIAWGATLSYIDCEDFFIEKQHPEDPTRYQFQGTWQQAHCIPESIPVRGRPDHIESVRITRHGPLVSPTLVPPPSPHEAVALASIALQPEIDFEGFGRLNEAHNWDTFVDAVRYIQSPSLNFLYADTSDNIGHWVSGQVPIRAKGDGLLPVPGWRGEHEWVDTVPFDQMPHAFNPRRGYIISANNKIINDDYPFYLGQVWRSGYRAQRIKQLITAQEQVSPADCQRFQLDYGSIPGLALIQQLTTLAPTNPDAALSLRLLRQWDGWLGPESRGGVVYEVFLNQLAQAILSPHFTPQFIHQFLGLGPHPYLTPVNDFKGYWSATMLRWLQSPKTEWLPDSSVRTAVLTQALAGTTAVLRAQLGDDPQQWQWGQLHQVRFPHALGLQPPLDTIFNQGPYPIGGDTDTITQTGIRPDLPYENNAISVSSRAIIDLGHWDNSVAIHPPGQSGHLGSPHYGDLIQPWLHGGYFPMTWEPEAVSAAAQHTLTLTPTLSPKPPISTPDKT